MVVALPELISFPVVGWVMHAILALVMLPTAVFKLLKVGPKKGREELRAMGLGSQERTIGFGELLCAVLLVLPMCLIPAILLTSAFFGGAIVAHMTRSQSYKVPAVFLVLAWIGFAFRFYWITT